jgi:bifunctional DNA-binding transcriptional regulator/antitoxin component of YhaV-PrlF toxin-antitoxin module
MCATGDVNLQQKSCIVPQEVLAMKTTGTARGQTIVPVKIRKAHQIGSQTQLEWIDDGKTIRVVPLPADTVRAAKGSTKGLHQKLLEARAWERRRG